jgi:hypothetical protein
LCADLPFGVGGVGKGKQYKLVLDFARTDIHLPEQTINH